MSLPLPRPSTSGGPTPSLPSTTGGTGGTLRSLRQRFSLSRPVTAPSSVYTPSPGFYPLPLPSSSPLPSSPPPLQQSAPAYTQAFSGATGPVPSPIPSPAPSQASSYLPSPAPTAPPVVVSRGHQKRRSFGIFSSKKGRAPSGAGISSADIGHFFPDAYTEGRATIELGRPAELGYSQPLGPTRNTLEIPREPVPTNGFPPGIANMAYMHQQQYERPMSPGYLSPPVSPPAGVPSATFFTPNIRAYSPQPGAPSPSPRTPELGLPSLDRSPSGVQFVLGEDPAVTLEKMREAVAQMQGIVESAVARAASPLPFHASTPQKPMPPLPIDPLAQSISDTTISSIPTITPAPRKNPTTQLTLTLTPSSPSPPRPAPMQPKRSNTEPTVARTRRTSTENTRNPGGEVLFQRAISPLAAQQRPSLDSQRSGGGRGTPLVSPGQRSVSVASVMTPGLRSASVASAVTPHMRSVSAASATSPGSSSVLSEAERRMPWRERIALRRERQAVERAELGVASARSPSASSAAPRRPPTSQQHHTHSRQASGASEYFSVRAKSPDLREEDLGAEPEPEAEGEADADADAEESRVIDERDERTARTADWLGSGPGRRAFRAAGLLEDVQEAKKESCPPTSGTRTARRGRHTPSSASQSTATRRRTSGSETPSLSLPSRSVSATPSLIVDSSQTPTTATTPSTFGDPLSPPGLAQVLELHNLEKGALLGALQESKRRERERDEEVRRMAAELELLRTRIRELEVALAKQQASQQGTKKSRLPQPKPRMPSGVSSVDARPASAAHRIRRSDSASTLGAPRVQQVPISPPSSGRGHSRSGSDSPTRVHRPASRDLAPEPVYHEEEDEEQEPEWVTATPRKQTHMQKYEDSDSDSESLRLKTEDERHLQEFVDVTLGAPSDDESFY